MNVPRLAKACRRLGFWIGSRAKWFAPQEERKRDQEFLQGLYKSMRLQSKLDKLTDRELVKVIGDKLNFKWDSLEDALVNEIVFRLVRANGGATDYEAWDKDNQPVEKQ